MFYNTGDQTVQGAMARLLSGTTRQDNLGCHFEHPFITPNNICNNFQQKLFVFTDSMFSYKSMGATSYVQQQSWKTHLAKFFPRYADVIVHVDPGSRFSSEGEQGRGLTRAISETVNQVMAEEGIRDISRFPHEILVISANNNVFVYDWEKQEFWKKAGNCENGIKKHIGREDIRGIAEFATVMNQLPYATFVGPFTGEKFDSTIVGKQHYRDMWLELRDKLTCPCFNPNAMIEQLELVNGFHLKGGPNATQELTVMIDTVLHTRNFLRNANSATQGLSLWDYFLTRCDIAEHLLSQHVATRVNSNLQVQLDADNRRILQPLSHLNYGDLQNVTTAINSGEIPRAVREVRSDTLKQLLAKSAHSKAEMRLTAYKNQMLFMVQIFKQPNEDLFDKAFIWQTINQYIGFQRPITPGSVLRYLTIDGFVPAERDNPDGMLLLTYPLAKTFKVDDMNLQVEEQRDGAKRSGYLG